MINDIYSANELYEMIRNYYIKIFPQECSYKKISEQKDIFTEIFADHMKSDGFPVFVGFEPTAFSGPKQYLVEKILEDMVKLPESEQIRIMDFVDVELPRKLNKIMTDIIDMHTWLVNEGYIIKRVENKTTTLYMSTKFLDKDVLMYNNR